MSRGRDLTDPELDIISETIEPTDEEVKAYIDQYYKDNPNIQRTPFNDGILGITFKKNYGKKPTRQTPQDRLPPQMISEDDIPYEPLDEPIDNVPPPPTTAIDLGATTTPKLLGGMTHSDIKDTFSGGGSLLDNIGESVAEGVLGMGGASLSDFEPNPQTHQHTRQADASTDANTHNVVGGTNAGGGGDHSLGNSEDAPTAPRTHNRATQIVSLVVDSLGDRLTNYLLHRDNRRRLNSSLDTIRQIYDAVNFAKDVYTNPVEAIGKKALRGTITSLTGLDGQNAFDVLYQNNKLTDEEKQTIDLQKMSLFRTKQRIAQNHLGIDSNGDMFVKTAEVYLGLKESGEAELNKPNRMKAPVKRGEREFLRHPVVIPYMILAVVFYQALHDKSVDTDMFHSRNIVSDSLIKVALQTILTEVLGLDSKAVDFGLYVYQSIPNELITAYKKNISKKTGLFKDERIAIQQFVRGIEDKFNSVYNKTFQKAVKEYQGQNINLWTNLAHLDTDDVLHSIATQLLTADSLIWESINNTGLFLGLVELTSIHKKKMGDLYVSDSNVGDDFFVEGVVEYLGKNKTQQNLNDPVINAMVDIERNGGALKIKGTDNVGLYKNGNDYIVAVKGSKLPTDLQPNFDNVAGSEELFNTDRYKDADGLLEEAQALADKSGGEVHSVGHSLGGTILSHLATKHHSVKSHIYEPVISNNDMTKKMIKETQHADIDFNIIDGSPISANLEGILADASMMGYDIRGVLNRYKQKRMSSHSVMNFV